MEHYSFLNKLYNYAATVCEAWCELASYGVCTYTATVAKRQRELDLPVFWRQRSLFCSSSRKCCVVRTSLTELSDASVLTLPA